MKGKIENIKIYSAKGEPGKELLEARLIENMGLEGDLHAKGGERQISLRFAGNAKLNEAPAEKGLCTSRFRENITILCDAPLISFKSGARLVIGEAILEISGETKHCHEECVLFQAGKLCSLAGLSLFAKVLKGGVIRIGDDVSITP